MQGVTDPFPQKPLKGALAPFLLSARLPARHQHHAAPISSGARQLAVLDRQPQFHLQSPTLLPNLLFKLDELVNVIRIFERISEKGAAYAMVFFSFLLIDIYIYGSYG